MKKRKVNVVVNPNEPQIITDFKRDGEKGVVGKSGFYPVFDNEYENGGENVYIEVTIVAVEMDGCSPTFKLKPVAGHGEFYLDSSCKFFPSLAHIEAKKVKEEREKAIDNDRSFLHKGSLVSIRIKNLLSYITTKVPGAFSHELIAAELKLDGISEENPRFQSKHLAKYGSIAVAIVHGLDPHDEIDRRHYY